MGMGKRNRATSNKKRQGMAFTSESARSHSVTDGSDVGNVRQELLQNVRAGANHDGNAYFRERILRTETGCLAGGSCLNLDQQKLNERVFE